MIQQNSSWSIKKEPDKQRTFKLSNNIKYTFAPSGATLWRRGIFTSLEQPWLSAQPCPYAEVPFNNLFYTLYSLLFPSLLILKAFR